MAAAVLDVRDLPDERVEYLKNLIELWRTQRQGEQGKIRKKEIEFTSQDSRTVGPITRDEIYDDIAT